jgi:cellulose synthase/poly-beta-1,6-N-acetylglucosamine synthase-like glycosyltransferase
VLAFLFWLSLVLFVYTHIGYPLLLRLLVSFDATREVPSPVEPLRPPVSLIIAAHNEEDLIERKLDNALSLDYPRAQLEIIVACDGCTDGTVEIARRVAAREGRIHVLDLTRRGKVPAQDAAVEVAGGEVLAFSDANAFWESGALEMLVRRFVDERVGYVCGELRYLNAEGANQEGTYWRFENWVRGLESRLGSITAGNGAIYAVRRSAYIQADPRTSHDLSFPFNLVKRGWRCVFEPQARAIERPLPTVETEFHRKRRMMSHAWPIVFGGMLDPRGYGLRYGFEIFSHRVLRYATPLLHVVALITNIALVGRGSVYVLTLACQLAVLAGAWAGRVTGGRARVLSLLYYYVLVTASLAAGFWDWVRGGTPTTWERAEGRS